MMPSDRQSEQKSKRPRGRKKRDYQLVSFLAGLTGSEVAESILVFLAREDDCYSSKISSHTGFPHQAIGSQLRRLEGAGIVLRRTFGRTSCYSFNRSSPWISHFIVSVQTYLNHLPVSAQEVYFNSKKHGHQRISPSHDLARK